MGEGPDTRRLIVVRVESTGKDGRPVVPISGPPGFPRPDAVWDGKLVLRPLT